MKLLLFSYPLQSPWMLVLILIASIAVVLWGAESLTKGAVGLAERMGVSQLMIGLTVVAMGTSMPEFSVSLISALKGSPDLAVGNIVGSNTFNALLIIGLAALVAPITITNETIKKDIPFAIVASIVLLILSIDGQIGRIDALIFMILFVIFMVFTLRGAKSNETDEHSGKSPMKLIKGIGLVLFGLIALIFGSSVFVDNATTIAHLMGVSDAVIGLTIVAGGTSLPELATSVVAARQGNSGIAIGNVVGSNVFNILFILGVTGIISPMSIVGITMVDMSVMVGAMILLWLFSYTRNLIVRWEGAVLSSAYLAYVGYLIMQAI